MLRRYLPGSENLQAAESGEIMRIYATVLLGPGSEKTVRDALLSASECVDGYILIESGGGDPALRAALDAAAEKDLAVTIRDFSWTGSYADARNAALSFARHIDGGCDFALTLDPDERIVDGKALRAEVERHGELFDVFVARERRERYFKERVIRCDAGLHWHGRVCEQLNGQRRPQARLKAEFWELEKSPESENRRRERGVVECQRMIDEGDDCYRWRRHLATCLLGLERRDAALPHLRMAHQLASNDEDKAWSWYMLCEQRVISGELEGAMEDAARGLVDHAGFLPEYAWIIAYCQLQAGNHQNALRWAQLGVQCPDDRTRLSFRSPTARSGCRQILSALLQKGGPGDFQGRDFEARKAFAPNYAQLAAAVVSALSPAGHLDLGAGNGLFVEPMSQHVVSVGVELSKDARAATSEATRELITYGAGTDVWGSAGRYDLVSCLEVLEHIPAEQADSAVSAICSCSTRWILFSAAPPGQAGKGHINCQPKEYWRAKFAANGFEPDEDATARVLEPIRNMQPCWWLPQNIMVFRRIE